MPVNYQAVTSLAPVKGVRLGAIEANLRYKDRDDLTLIEVAEGSSVAGVFTQNAFCAAPVTVCKEHLEQTEDGIRYLVINAGNANAGTGEEGLTSAQMICAEIAEETLSALNSILPFSTGVIGEQLPYWDIVEKVPELIESLAEDNWMKAGASIMTTDTTLKGVSKSVEVNGKVVTITGITKGAGMIEPNMATMLAYVATDVGVDSDELQSILNNTVKDSFNSITVDSDTSTNDSLILMATGKSGVHLNDVDEINRALIIDTIDSVCKELSQAIIRDAEGATKFVTVKVESAPDYDYAKEIAYSVARSPLVKTALFASDPNWGRLLMAIGKTPVKDLDVTKISLFLGDTQLLENGEPLESYEEAQGQIEMDKEEITIRIQLNAGDEDATVWTSDLSHEYVTINAEYRS